MTAEMRIVHLLDVKDLQHMESVSGTLNEGIVSVCNTYKSLLDAQVDPTTDMCTNYKQIRKHIEHAEWCLKKSESVIKEKMEYLNEHMERLFKEKENLEQQNKEKCLVIDKLHIEKKSAEESLKYSNKALEQAEKNVALTKDKINKEIDRKNTGVGVAIGGAALTFIPFIGWIAGPIMMFKGGSEIVEASNAIRNAEDELKKHDSQVKDNNIKVSNYQSRISNIHKEIKEINKVLNEIHMEIEVIKQHFEVTADIQQRVRRAVHLLCVFSGRVTALEKQTQGFILWEPVMNVMEEVMKAVEHLV